MSVFPVVVCQTYFIWPEATELTHPNASIFVFMGGFGGC